jgi:anti-sigma regulatory factor (Ser/Thr protein kinase)
VEIVLQNQPDEKARLLAGLSAFAAEHHLPPGVVQAVDLALEEHLTNVLNYGYEDKGVHEIRVRFSIQERSLHVEVEDDARAYNPLERPTVDTSAPLDGRKIGGLGVHLMRHFMDQLDYRYEGNRNILRMTKRIDV